MPSEAFSTAATNAAEGHHGFGAFHITLDVAAARVPATPNRDGIITFIIAFILVAMVVAVARLRRFAGRQLRSFFHPPNRLISESSETSAEIGFCVFLGVVTCLAVSLLLYMQTFSSEPHAEASKEGSYGMLAGCFLLLVLLYAVRFMLYGLTGWVFFERLSNIIWLKSQLLAWAMAGVVLYPLVLGVVYYGMSSSSAVAIMVGIVAAVEVLMSYKSYLLFFRKKHMLIQNVVYICSLEAVPLLLLLTALSWI